MSAARQLDSDQVVEIHCLCNFENFICVVVVLYTSDVVHLSRTLLLFTDDAIGSVHGLHCILQWMHDAYMCNVHA